MAVCFQSKNVFKIKLLIRDFCILGIQASTDIKQQCKPYLYKTMPSDMSHLYLQIAVVQW